MGAMERRKGRAYEQELARRFREVMPGADVRRGLQGRDGADAADVETPCFWIEAKRGRKPNVRAALKQAAEAAPRGRVPVAVIRDDRAEAFVAMSLEDFLDFVGEWWERGTT